MPSRTGCFLETVILHQRPWGFPTPTHHMPDTAEKWQWLTCKGTAIARDILELKPSEPCLFEMYLCSLHLVGQTAEAQVPPAAPLTWPQTHQKMLFIIASNLVSLPDR